MRATVNCICGGGTLTFVGYAHIAMHNGTIAARNGKIMQRMLQKTATASEIGWSGVTGIYARIRSPSLGTPGGGNQIAHHDSFGSFIRPSQFIQLFGQASGQLSTLKSGDRVAILLKSFLTAPFGFIKFLKRFGGSGPGGTSASK